LHQRLEQDAQDLDQQGGRFEFLSAGQSQ
jgi:hypothetical protein